MTQAEEFRKKLKECKLLMKDFCKQTGLATSTAYNWSNGKTIPKWVFPYLDLYAKSNKIETTLDTVLNHEYNK